jgi:hypothetical protein
LATRLNKINYPKKETQILRSRDKKSGGSVSEIVRTPDFENFSEEDHKEYKQKKLQRESSKLKMYLAWIAFGIIMYLTYLNLP